MNGFALFHLNLAFSSIEEEQRATVVRDCYGPLLELAEKHGPIGIEATAYTLQAIAKCDKAWLARLKDLIGRGRVEFIGSGYAQAIGPLLPADMVAANLRLGNAAYHEMLGLTPRIGLINEQAWSGGLVGQYLDAGYSALLVDWDNVANFHPGWTPDMRYAPQRALGSDGRDIPILWTNTVAFQKLQRLAHDDIPLEDYLGFVSGQCGEGHRTLCLYASDAEIFGFRPGRYRTEESNQGGTEWTRLHAAFEALNALPGVRLVSPSDALEQAAVTAPIRLETAAYPIPVKKQRKYNVTRWAVSGRDDIAINAACQRIYQALKRTNAPDDDWRELCRLWASDFRTHITQARWEGYCRDLSAMEARLGTRPAAALPAPAGETVTDRHIEIETPSLRVRLDRRRGLAIQRAGFAPDFTPLIGGIPHGHFDDIALQADWYTGDCVFEAPGEPKVTDLDWATTHIARAPDGSVTVHGAIATPLGPILKVMTFHADIPRIDFDLEFQWQAWGRGALRLGHITLRGEAFDEQSLAFTTTNGGAAERFALAGQTVEHGAPVSFLVSAACALGMTEGWLELADARRKVRIEVDRAVAPLVGLINHRSTGGKLFCQLLLSALELDDTRKPSPYGDGPRRFRFSVMG
ncbi:MAG: hypothetical protein JF627_03985 [Alphaproteobacteria bacterium]|nr:hypothetical protein [Alphaproteobacteria bacterium]